MPMRAQLHWPVLIRSLATAKTGWNDSLTTWYKYRNNDKTDGMDQIGRRHSVETTAARADTAYVVCRPRLQLRHRPQLRERRRAATELATVRLQHD